MSIIDVQGLCFDYPAPEEGKPPVTVLKNIDLQIEKGEFTAILGHNGSGKSTLAKHFNAILLPTSGKVTVCGINTADEERVYDIRQRVGMVFQNPDNQLVATVVEEDVAFALENLGIPQAEMRKRVDEALKSVEMYEYRNHSPHQLSGGQKQRIAVAGVIAMRPECLVLDEPTAMLDPRGRKEIMKTLKTLHEDYGITIVLITHYMEEAAQAERVIVMDSGKIILDGKPKSVFSKVDLLKSVGLDVPQSTELAYELKKAGIDIPLDLLTEEEAANAVFALLEKGGKA